MGQTATSPNEGSQMSYDIATGSHTFRWWAKNGYYYCIQQREDLMDGSWTYFPYGVKGQGGIEGINFTGTSGMLFMRLQFSDDPEADFLVADWDNDGVNSADEMDQGTNPFTAFSEDGDTIPDDWETYYGLDTTTGVDSSQHNGDEDTLTDYQEYHTGTNPTVTNTLSADSSHQADVVVWTSRR
jgi:hypothetical protein